MLEEIEVVAPEKIEERSMEIITASMKPERLTFYTEKELKVVKRCIHTSADFDYEDKTMLWSQGCKQFYMVPALLQIQRWRPQESIRRWLMNLGQVYIASLVMRKLRN